MKMMIMKTDDLKSPLPQASSRLLARRWLWISQDTFQDKNDHDHNGIGHLDDVNPHYLDYDRSDLPFDISQRVRVEAESMRKREHRRKDQSSENFDHDHTESVLLIIIDPDHHERQQW